MSRLRGLWTATAAVTVFLITACARPGSTPNGRGEAVPSGASLTPATADALVLRVERFGGLMAPEQTSGTLPLLSVYGDGRLITQGPQIAIYPPPALPNVQVRRLDRTTVTELLAKADAAGVRPGLDLGQPSVADASTTRITVAAGAGTRTLEVVGLTEAGQDDPRLTPGQLAARAKVAAFVQDATDLSAAQGTPESKPYRPASVAALARPYVPPSDGLPQQPRPVDWPGPPLSATGCVIASGGDAGQVLTAATEATTITPWRSGGKTWTVRFRPLLPDETGCADLTTTR